MCHFTQLNFFLAYPNVTRHIRDKCCHQKGDGAPLLKTLKLPAFIGPTTWSGKNQRRNNVFVATFSSSAVASLSLSLSTKDVASFRTKDRDRKSTSTSKRINIGTGKGPLFTASKGQYNKNSMAK